MNQKAIFIKPELCQITLNNLKLAVFTDTLKTFF